MTPEEQKSQDSVRAQERAVWTEVERVGATLRAAEAPRQITTQTEHDTAAQPKPTETA